jgi:hypothetical protein
MNYRDDPTWQVWHTELVSSKKPDESAEMHYQRTILASQEMYSIEVEYERKLISE